MKKLIITALLIGLVVSAQSVKAEAVGSVFGTVATAPALGQGNGNFGLGLGLADVTSFVGTFDYGLSKFTTGRLKLGFADDGDNSDMTLSFGAEFRWQIWSASNTAPRPFDLSIGAMTEYLSLDTEQGIGSSTIKSSLSVFQFGGIALGSHSFVMKNGKLITPYARLNVRLEDYKVEVAGIEASDSDIKIGLNTGVAYQVSNTMNLYGEFQIDGNDGVFLGIDFKVM